MELAIEIFELIEFLSCVGAICSIYISILKLLKWDWTRMGKIALSLGDNCRPLYAKVDKGYRFKC